MRWEGRRQSQNVEDRRSAGQQALVGGGLLTLVIMVVDESGAAVQADEGQP